ncbi:MAG: DUF4173 domain-containing protein [Phycisphaerales bacterium]|nr:MAG: DUF4173 domain-containing protein [Phycisphaerales bacterium]
MDTACTITPTPAEKSTEERPPQDVIHWILGVSLALGIAADGLLRSTPFGINVALFAGLLCLALTGGWRRHREQTPCWHLLALVLLLALGVAWRDCPVLHGLNLSAILTLLVLLTARPTRHGLNTTTLAALGRNMFCGITQASYSPISLFGRETDWQQASQKIQTNNTRRVLRGLGLALPLLLVFTLLFMAADAVFTHIVETTGERVADLMLENQYLAKHIVWSLVFFILAIFIVRPVTLGNRWEQTEVTPSWRPGTIELGIVIGSVLLLFLAFIAVQFRYLFGGDELVQTIPGLTYATYARKGFFALLCVVFLVHLVLLAGAWLAQGADPHTARLYRVLGLALVILTGFVFASAFFRMHLYVDAYGLTRLRFYAVAILLWLAVVFAMLVVRLLYPRWSCFTSGTLYSALALLLLLNLANPDGLIARVNLRRFTQGKDLDTEYLQKLSTDAIPVILDYEAHLSTEDHDALLAYIVINRTADSGWRSWNLSRTRALRQAPDLAEIQRLLEN